MIIRTILDLQSFLRQAIEICDFELIKVYECGAGKEHPDYSNLVCSKWIYEKLQQRVQPYCDEDITEICCDNVSTEVIKEKDDVTKRL